MISKALVDLVETADDGARLPTVRELMTRYSVGQATVQEAFTRLREDGLISSQVGRGSFVVKPDINVTKVPFATVPESNPGTLGSLLILANSSMNERCALVQSQIMAAISSEGGKVVQMSYHDTDHLLEILKSIPTFDAVILQSHYEVIPVRLLAMLQSKTRALVVDGHTVAGVDIDRTGIDWEDALDLAINHLVDLHHERIALVSLDSLAQPILGVRRYFQRIDNWRGQKIEGRSIILKGLSLPTQSVAEVFETALRDLREDDETEQPTALVFLGISDGMGIREVLRQEGVGVPQDMSIILLGHPDVPTEHLGLFTVIGGTRRQGAEALLQILRKRLANPTDPPQTVYLNCEMRARESTGFFSGDE